MRRRLRRLFVPAAAAVGAAIMYLFDPREGKRRRAVTRDQTSSAIRRLKRRAEKRKRYIEGKAHGLVHELHGEAPKLLDDATVKHKIESEVLRHFDGPRINVNVDEGIAVLRGELKRPEDIRRLEREVEKMPGVVAVKNLVHTPTR